MSLLFLGLTVITFLVSHFWAGKNRPKRPSRPTAELLFNGFSEEFIKNLQQALQNNKRLKLLKWTKTEIIISENAGLFRYGTFYHLDLNNRRNDILVLVYIQPKLIGPQHDISPSVLELFKKIELKNVG